MFHSFISSPVSEITSTCHLLENFIKSNYFDDHVYEQAIFAQTIHFVTGILHIQAA